MPGIAPITQSDLRDTPHERHRDQQRAFVRFLHQLIRQNKGPVTFRQIYDAAPPRFGDSQTQYYERLRRACKDGYIAVGIDPRAKDWKSRQRKIYGEIGTIDDPCAECADEIRTQESEDMV